MQRGVYKQGIYFNQENPNIGSFIQHMQFNPSQVIPQSLIPLDQNVSFADQANKAHWIKNLNDLQEGQMDQWFAHNSLVLANLNGL